MFTPQRSCRLINNYSNALYGSIIRNSIATAKKSRPTATLLKNKEIRHPKLRVVFTDESNNSQWKIMSRTEALEFAQLRSLDLVLVNGNADPPVCKLEDFGQKIMSIKKKEKEKDRQNKARAMKEMVMSCGIEKRDLDTKMKKVREFLTKGHVVKATIIPKFFSRKNRFRDGVRRDRMEGFEETILHFLEAIEDLPVQIQDKTIKTQTTPPAESKSDSDSESNSDSDSEEEPESAATQTPLLRREFILTPVRHK